jgi:hypothetical protein
VRRWRAFEDELIIGGRYRDHAHFERLVQYESMF